MFFTPIYHNNPHDKLSTSGRDRISSVISASQARGTSGRDRISSVISASQRRGDNLYLQLTENTNFIRVQKNCVSKYTSSTNIKAYSKSHNLDLSEPVPKRLRSTTSSPLDFNQH